MPKSYFFLINVSLKQESCDHKSLLNGLRLEFQWDDGSRNVTHRALSSRRDLLQVVPGRQDENALDFLAEIRPKVANIAGNEMSCFPFDSGKDDRSILVGQRNSLRQVARRYVEEINASGIVSSTGRYVIG